MDAFNSSRKISKLKSVTGNISPVDSRLNADSTLIRYLRAGGSPITSSLGNRTGSDAFSSPSISINSSRGGSSIFGRSLSPLSAIENLISPPVYGTPAKLVDEDVLVMDGIFVESSSGGRVSGSLSSDSTGSSSNSASFHGVRGYKMELCRSWEDIGQCRSGSKCQFSHGKEELRPSFFLMKNKPETQSLKPDTNASSSYVPKSRFLPSVKIEAPTEASPTAIFFRPQCKSQSLAINSNNNPAPMYFSKSPTFIKPESSKKSPISNNIISRDWLPSDDGIEVRLAGNVGIHPPSNEDVNSYIRSVLHGPRNRRRLPIFTEFCPR